MTLDEWSKLGEAVGGFSTALGVAFAAGAFFSWRHEKRAEKMHDAAVETLTAVTSACGALRLLAEPHFAAQLKADQDLDQREAEFRKRDSQFDAIWKQLDKAAGLVSLYLDREWTFLALLRKKRALVRLAFSEHVYALKRGDAAEAEEQWNSVFGSDARQEIDTCEKWANDGLRPIIRFESRVKWWRIPLAPVLLPYFLARQGARRLMPRRVAFRDSGSTASTDNDPPCGN